MCKNYGTLILFLLSLCVINSCCNPDADFRYSATNYWTLENIYFINLSTEAYYYTWDFGDKVQSEEVSPYHFYDKPGNYIIKLHAFSKNGNKVDSVLKEIEITQPTDLLIKVINLKTKTPFPDCSVALYKTYEDYKNALNCFISSATNENGYCMIRNLENAVYYIEVYKSENDGLWSNDKLGYITDTLKTSSINYYDVFVDFYRK
jgi:PKD repeat protein